MQGLRNAHETVERNDQGTLVQMEG